MPSSAMPAAAPVDARIRSEWEPWFGRRPEVALLVIAALYVCVFLLRLLVGSAVDASSMLYVLPVALAATAFGRTAGVAAGLVAVGLIGAWALLKDVSMGPWAWGARILPMLLLGYLLGSAMDRLRRAEHDRRELELAALLHREAIEISDSLIQRMMAAKWAIEAGQVEATEHMLSEAMDEAQRLVSDLISRAGMGGRTVPLPAPAPERNRQRFHPSEDASDGGGTSADRHSTTGRSSIAPSGSPSSGSSDASAIAASRSGTRRR